MTVTARVRRITAPDRMPGWIGDEQRKAAAIARCLPVTHSCETFLEPGGSTVDRFQRRGLGVAGAHVGSRLLLPGLLRHGVCPGPAYPMGMVDTGATRPRAPCGHRHGLRPSPPGRRSVEPLLWRAVEPVAARPTADDVRGANP